MNFNHLPSGRPDGGQFTFADVGGRVMPYYDMRPNQDVNEDASPIKPEHIAAPVSQIPDAAIMVMQSELRQHGVDDDEIVRRSKEKLGKAKLAGKNIPTSWEDMENNLNEVIRDSYFTDVVGGRVGASVRTMIDRNSEVIANGGVVRALANDDGSFQILHGTSNTVSMYLDRISDVGEGSAVVYNPKSGVLRSDALIVPIPKTAQRIGAASSDQSKRNRLNGVALNADRRGRKASRIVNKRIGDATSVAGRQLGSGDYAGRIGVCIAKDDNGDLVVQNCIICDGHEGEIADMYAKELGMDILRASRPAPDVSNPEPGDPSILHEGGMYVGKSDFGGISAGVKMDKGKRSQVSSEDAQKMFDRHDELKKQRDDEYRRAHDGEERPAKTERQREHERLLRKQRKLRRMRAEKAIGTENEPIRLKGGGYIFPGETIKRGGKEYTYEDIMNGNVQESKGVGQRVANERSKKEGTTAVGTAKRRQTIKEGNKNRKQQQRAREAAIKKAHAEGKGAVTFREGKNKASGRTILVIEGEPGYEEALKYKTAKVYPAG